MAGSQKVKIRYRVQNFRDDGSWNLDVREFEDTFKQPREKRSPKLQSIRRKSKAA